MVFQQTNQANRLSIKYKTTKTTHHWNKRRPINLKILEVADSLAVKEQVKAITVSWTMVIIHDKQQEIKIK